jgi:hypothetical protein
VTTLRKAVRRRTARAYAVLYRSARPIVVTLLPGDVLEFREHGRRCRWLLAVDTAFKYAVRLKAFQDAAEKRRRKAVAA